MQLRATLGGVSGAVDLNFRFRNGVDGEWRGTFFFGADDEVTIARMVGDRPAVLETTLEEERRILPVMVTSFTPNGVAFYTDEPSVPTDRPGIAPRRSHN